MKQLIACALIFSCLFSTGAKNLSKARFNSIESASDGDATAEKNQVFKRNRYKRKICFIINPISGAGKYKKVHSLIKKYLNTKYFDHQIFYTNRPKHATQLAQMAAKKKWEIVVAVGGDGTIHEVAQGLLGSSTALGIIPTGSGNGLACHFNIPTDIKEAIDVINEENDQWIDTVKINHEFYIGIAGIGFDADVSHAFSERSKRGFSSYIKVVLSELPNYQSKEYELIIDGNPLIEKAFLICFANSKQYGNNAFIAPHAKIDDGLLDVVILKAFPKHAAPKLIADLFNGRIEDSRYTTVIRCQEVIVKKPLHYLHLDGEPKQFDEDVYIRILPSSLKICIPKDAYQWPEPPL